MTAARPLTPGEQHLVDAVRREVAALGLPAQETAVALSRVEEGLVARRAPDHDDETPADRVPPALVARAVAGVARPVLRPGRSVATVRVAEATPTDLARELVRRLQPSPGRTVLSRRRRPPSRRS